MPTNEQLVLPDGSVCSVRKHASFKVGTDGTRWVKEDSEKYVRYYEDTQSWEPLTAEELVLFFTQKYTPAPSPVSHNPSRWPAVERHEAQSIIERSELVETERAGGVSCDCGWYFIQCTCGRRTLNMPGLKHAHRCGRTVARDGHMGSSTVRFCSGEIPKHIVRGYRVREGCDRCRPDQTE